MLNKNLLFGMMAISLLPMFSANASMAMDDENDSDVIYLRLGYQAMYVSDHTIDLAKDTKVDTAVTPNTAVGATTDYKPKYNINFMGGSIGVGKSFSSEARAELEVAAHSQVEIDNSGKIEYFNNKSAANANAAFVNKGFKFGMASLNLYYDIDSGKSGFTPYIGGGIGIARVNFLSSPTSETVTYPVALQLKAGVQMKVNNMPTLFMGYKLIYLAQKESTDTITSFVPSDATAITSTIKSSYTLHNFDVGFMLVK